MRLTLFAWLCSLFIALGGTFAQAQASVSAALSSDRAEAGEQVTLQITFTGSGDAEQPELPDVPGLTISYAGQSSQYQLNNFRMTSSVVYSYAVSADQPGDYTIPALSLQVGGDHYTTRALTLHVNGSASANQGSSAAGTETARAFATINFPKTTAYLGEALPVEIKLFVDTRIRWELRDVPTLKNDGFTVAKLKLTNQGTTEQNGRVYDLFVFKTALTPVKAGELAAGPCEFQTLMQIPQSQPQRRARRSNSPFDRFFSDDGFPDPFGQSNFVTRQVKVTAPTVALHVKPLPTAGQPADFSGAVGLFRLGSQSSASEAKAGEPLTLTASVNGHGNFDRVQAPQLPATPGWRGYPATGTFKPDDDLGISGSKSFKITLVPAAGQQQLPALNFTYFDPEQEKYVTLHTARAPVNVEGAVAATATPAPAPALAAAPPAPAPAIARDIHYILPEAAWQVQAFTPLYRQRAFLVGQAVPLAALLGFIALRLVRTRVRDSAQERARQLARTAARLEAEWRNPALGRGTFADAAVAWMETQKAGAAPEPRAVLDELVNLQGELRYAGSSNRHEPLPPERRARFIAALETLKAKQ